MKPSNRPSSKRLTDADGRTVQVSVKDIEQSLRKCGRVEAAPSSFIDFDEERVEGEQIEVVIRGIGAAYGTERMEFGIREFLRCLGFSL